MGKDQQRNFEELADEEKFVLLSTLIEVGLLDIHLNLMPEGEDYIYRSFDYGLCAEGEQ